MLDEMKYQNDKFENSCEKSKSSKKLTFGYSKKLDNFCEIWLKFINEDSVKLLDSEFNELNKIREQNVSLLKEIQSKQEKAINELIKKSELNINNKSSNELTENDLNKHLNELQICLNSLESDLIAKKEKKKELTDETQTLSKRVEELKNRGIELKKENNENNNNECKALTNAMRIKYKTWNNSKVIGLVFNDNENLERLIIVDKENKSEEEIAEEFWSSLNEDYDI